MNDADRQAPPQSDIDRRLPIKEVLPFFRKAGLPRDIRSLQRYCESGLLDGLKEITATGETWFITEDSIAPAITQLKQMHNAKGLRQATTLGDMSGTVGNEPASLFGPVADGHSATGSDDDGRSDSNELAGQDPTGGDSEPVVSAYVGQLEKRLDEKNDEIEFLREELTDRREQIRDMKGIIDGQNALLETINTNVAPIFKALATSVENNQIQAPKPPDLASKIIEEAQRPTTPEV